MLKYHLYGQAQYGCVDFVSQTQFLVYMGESFQDYSWIQDFGADFP